jgi:hypothetical protein
VTLPALALGDSSAGHLQPGATPQHYPRRMAWNLSKEPQERARSFLHLPYSCAHTPCPCPFSFCPLRSSGLVGRGWRSKKNTALCLALGRCSANLFSPSSPKQPRVFRWQQRRSPGRGHTGSIWGWRAIKSLPRLLCLCNKEAVTDHPPRRAQLCANRHPVP